MTDQKPLPNLFALKAELESNVKFPVTRRGFPDCFEDTSGLALYIPASRIEALIAKLKDEKSDPGFRLLGTRELFVHMLEQLLKGTE